MLLKIEPHSPFIKHEKSPDPPRPPTSNHPRVTPSPETLLDENVIQKMTDDLSVYNVCDANLVTSRRKITQFQQKLLACIVLALSCIQLTDFYSDPRWWFGLPNLNGWMLSVARCWQQWHARDWRTGKPGRRNCHSSRWWIHGRNSRTGDSIICASQPRPV